MKDYKARARFGGGKLTRKGGSIVKEIKVTDLTSGKMNIAEEWDNLPTAQRVEIARKAGIAGRVGSSSWASLHEIDREAILSRTIPEPTAEQIKSYEKQKLWDAGESEPVEIVVKYKTATGVWLKMPPEDAIRRRQVLEEYIELTGRRLERLKATQKRKPNWEGYDPFIDERVGIDVRIEEQQAVLEVSNDDLAALNEAMEKVGIPPRIVPVDEIAPIVQDYLLWVGWGSYPTIKSFVTEANTMGVSRRISKIPKDLVLGKSKIFLAHDEGETGDAVIFGYFVPTGIEMIVFDSTTINGLGLRKDMTPITLEQASAEDERGCGMRVDVGSIYLVSYVDEDLMRQMDSLNIDKDAQLRGTIVMLKPPKDYNRLIDSNGRRFRGIKKVDGQMILSGETKKEPSLRYKVSRDQKMPRKKGDKWSPEEIELLRKLTSEMRPRRAFREMMKITGRSLSTMEWHYRKIRESEKESSQAPGSSSA